MNLGHRVLIITTILFLVSCGKEDDAEPNNNPFLPPIENENESDPPQEQAVDLGIGILWGAWNIGATSPEEQGKYYAWGELQEKSDYTWETYKHYDLNSETITDIGSCISNTEYDIARAAWGEDWRMPTMDEIKQLVSKCSWEWTTYKGVNGQLVTGPSGNSIFLPATGYRYGDTSFSKGYYGYYWSGSRNESDTSNSRAGYLLVSYSNGAWYWDFTKNCGFTVRAVKD